MNYRIKTPLLFLQLSNFSGYLSVFSGVVGEHHCVQAKVETRKKCFVNVTGRPVRKSDDDCG